MRAVMAGIIRHIQKWNLIGNHISILKIVVIIVILVTIETQIAKIIITITYNEDENNNKYL